VALVVGLCAVYSILLTGLWWLVEQVTDGWGIQMHFFQVPRVLWGPWYQVLVTNFVLLSLTFLTGMLFGLIYRRFALIGTVIFSGGVTVVIVAAALIVTWQEGWPRVGDFLMTLNLIEASGLLAIVALVGRARWVRNHPPDHGLMLPFSTGVSRVADLRCLDHRGVGLHPGGYQTGLYATNLGRRVRIRVVA